MLPENQHHLTAFQYIQILFPLASLNIFLFVRYQHAYD